VKWAKKSKSKGPPLWLRRSAYFMGRLSTAVLNCCSLEFESLIWLQTCLVCCLHAAAKDSWVFYSSSTFVGVESKSSTSMVTLRSPVSTVRAPESGDSEERIRFLLGNAPWLALEVNPYIAACSLHKPLF